ncbi:MFS domain-containing protein [Trichoderma simmonsii]|uniref:MFS domain-containing protein n=1 Tax=Trichoderma simmonsii TaxID=1491479 RepID=A0A8G0PGA8_9HYPO|nr:MFS domain-containing protein [Trichoderma simmonsii]
MTETTQIDHELFELHERKNPEDGGPRFDSSSSPPNVQSSSIGKRPECFQSTFQEICFIFMATLAMATNSLVTGAMIIVTASIGRDLHMTQAQITWISAATTLSAGALQLPLGQLTDLLGRKTFFIAGMVGFSISSLILGFSRNPFWMNILCGFLGLFSAVIVPPAIGILGAAYSEPSKRKNWAFACFSAGNPVGFGLGSIIMGISARIFDWRAGFFFFTILWGLLAIVSIWVVPNIEAFEPGPFGKRLTAALRKFDYVGTVLTIVGVGLFTTGLTLGPVDGWKSAHVIAMLIAGFFLLVGFVVWEKNYPHPLMPLHIWKDRGFAFLMPVSIFGVMSMLSSNFWLALFLQEFHHRPALTVAVDLLPQVISALISNVVAANILHRVNNSLIIAFGAAMYLVANLLLAVQSPRATYWASIFPSLLTNVMGLDLQFNVANMYVMQSLPSHQQSLAGGIFNMFIRLGTTIIFGMSTAVYSSVKNTVEGQDDAFKPYRSAFYVSLGFASLACLFVPFLRIGTQGNSPKEE